MSTIIKNPGTSSNGDAGDASGCSAAETSPAKYEQAIITRPVYRGYELRRNQCNAPYINFKLSEDVLRYIFSWCAPGYVNLPFSSSELPFSFVLTHVCALWRRVAHDTPDLWNTICLDFLRIEEPHVQAWLLLAKRFRITLMMSNEIDDHHLNLFIPTILNSYRIGVLIVMITYEQLQTFLSGVRNEMVEHLTLYYGSWDGTYIPEELHQVPHFPFPNLKSFYFYSDYHRLELEWPRYFDWNRLCHLCLVMPIRPSKVWEILRQAMALESLKVFGLKPDVDGHHGAEAVTLPDLTSLSIQVLNYGEPCQLLHLLRYPNLEYLRIKGPNVVWDGGIFSSLARQSNFNKLQRFVFEGTITMDNFHVDRLLNDLPNLRKLSVPDGTKISQSTLMKLTDGGLGKHLTILAVGGVRLYSRRFESTMNSLYKG